MKLMLITGANGQLGSYLAKRYREEGFSLILLYHQRDDRLLDFIGMPEVFLCQVDLCDYDACAGSLARAVKHFGQSPELLIHCAAKRSSDALPLSETAPETFMHVFSSNYLAAYHILRLVLPFMQEKQFGRVVMLGSDVTRSGLQNGSAYASAKAAIVSLVKSVSREVAADNVLVNAISPGPVETVLEQDYSGEYLDFRRQYFAKVKDTVPTGKLVSLKELKLVVDLLIAEDLQSICGEELIINGGL